MFSSEYTNDGINRRPDDDSTPYYDIGGDYKYNSTNCHSHRSNNDYYCVDNENN